ncbi:MAG: hypothetical protein ACK5OW_00890 [bacterium]|jgi:hypothetical protein
MKKIKIWASALASMLLITSCSENYSNGERIGLVTQFSKSGIIWKSWEGHLNMTQTGMNSSTPFDFSIDNDNQDENLVKSLDSAANYGWKVKIVYHETAGYNWFRNRGETSHFVTKMEVLDRNPIATAFGNSTSPESKSGCNCKTTGKVIDTIYVVIDKTK